MKPLLLVDVDGVLNCFGAIWSPEYEAEHFEPVRVANGRFEIRLPKGTANRLRRLADHFDMTWATAWEDGAHPFFGEWLGLGNAWPVVKFTSGWIGEQRTWKLGDVIRYVEDRPAAWIDDDLQIDAYQWAMDRAAPTLLIRTNPCHGLSDEHVERLLTFAERIA